MKCLATSYNVPKYPTGMRRLRQPRKSDIIYADLCPRNPYEAQIFSGWGSGKGDRIDRFTYYKDPKKKINMHENDSEKKKKSNEMPEKSIFECDFYVKPLEKSADGNFYTPMTKSIPDFLREGTSLVIPMNDFARSKGDVSKPLEWILIEISDSPRQLINKLFQIERALFLCPELEKMGVSGTVVLLNGEKAVAESAIRGIKISDESRIAKYPVYVGWVPTRNIYASVAALQTSVAALQTSVAGLQTSMTEINAKLERLERFMEALLAK